MVSKYSLFIIAILLITPLNAVDLSGYDGYITPKFGAFVYGDYWYKSDLINWKWATPSFESNEGYYNIYEDSETIDFQITINTTFHGELYLVLHYKDSNGIYDFNDYLVHSGGAGDYSHVRYSEEIILPSDMYGEIYYQWVLSSGYWFGSSSAKFSKQYTFFTKRSLNTDWKQKRLITLSSTEKMQDGITQINLNKNITDELYILYSPDSDATGNLNSYSGTLTNLVFTNEDYTKAYPYFVNKFKGGYFEHDRTTKNNSVIDLWINENTTTKNLYMFYDFKYLVTPLFGWFDEYTLDKPNNPFTVHQVFSDWRWNESQINDVGTISYSHLFNYTRGEYIEAGYVHPSDVYVYFTPSGYNNVSQIYLNLDFGGSNIGCAYLTSDGWDIAYYQAPSFFIKNSTGSVNFTSANEGLFKIYLDSNFLKVDINNILNVTHPETSIKFNNLSKIGGWTYPTGSQYSRLENFYELPNNTISYSISNATTTDYAYINFIDLLEYETFLNDISVGGYIEIDNSGLFLCQDSNKNILGSVNIIKDSVTIESFEINFPYTITNKTYFLNISEFNYTCSFISVVGGFEITSENKTINFTNNKIFLDTIKPIHQNNYSSEYVTYNINSELNYTGLQTDFSVTTNKIQCLKVSDNKCIKYNFLNLQKYYNQTNISKINNYNEINILPVNFWYQQYYQFCRNEKCFSTPSRLFYVYETTEEILFPQENFVDFSDIDLTGNRVYMMNKLFENPLYYIAAQFYQLNELDFLQGNSRTFLKFILVIFFNFYFVLAFIFISSYGVTKNGKLSLIIISPFIFLFSFLNWIIGIIPLTIGLICLIGIYLLIGFRK